MNAPTEVGPGSFFFYFSPSSSFPRLHKRHVHASERANRPPHTGGPAASRPASSESIPSFLVVYFVFIPSLFLSRAAASGRPFSNGLKSHPLPFPSVHAINSIRHGFLHQPRNASSVSFFFAGSETIRFVIATSFEINRSEGPPHSNETQ